MRTEAQQLYVRYQSFADTYRANGQLEQAESCRKQAIDALEADPDCTICHGDGMIAIGESGNWWYGREIEIGTCPCIAEQVEALNRRPVRSAFFDDDGGPL